MKRKKSRCHSISRYKFYVPCEVIGVFFLKKKKNCTKPKKKEVIKIVLLCVCALKPLIVKIMSTQQQQRQ